MERGTATNILLQAVTLHKAGDLDVAERLYERVLKLQPQNADALNLLGVIAQHRGEIGRARDLFQRAIICNPASPDIHYNQGNLLLSVNETEAALCAYSRAIALKPDFTDALLNKGIILDRARRVEEAFNCFRDVATVAPRDPRGHYGLGKCLALLAKFDDAESSLRRAIELDPGYLDAHLTLASFYADKGLYQHAIIHTRRAIEIDPLPKFYSSLGQYLRRVGQIEEALNSHREALKISEDDPLILYNFGAALHEAGFLDEAQRVFRKSIIRDPSFIKAYVALAKVLEHQLLLQDAIAILGAALKLNPQSSELLFELSLLQLATGNFKEGWRNYEHRPSLTGEKERRTCQPAFWAGEDLTGKTILVWPEQGLGDEILHVGMLSDLIAQADRCILECSARLAPIFRRSFPMATIVSHQAPNATRKIQTQIDFQVSIASLGQFFRPNFRSFPHHEGYLKSSLARTSEMRKRYTAIAPGNLVVGISWRSTNEIIGTAKSADVSTWIELLEIPRVTFVNLQYGNTKNELAAVKRATGIDVFSDPEVDPLRDMDTFFAQVAAMDLVISTSNSAAHVAGSLNIPTWLLLPDQQAGLWYWFRDFPNSPWYPSVRILRGRPRQVKSCMSPWWQEIISSASVELSRKLGGR